MTFTCKAPDPAAFLYTLRELLIAEGQANAAAILIGADCEFRSDRQYSHQRWNSYNATLVLRVPVTSVPKLTDHIRTVMLGAADRTFPTEVGYELVEL
jgi:hypothetical protein